MQFGWKVHVTLGIEGTRRGLRVALKPDKSSYVTPNNLPHSRFSGSFFWMASDPDSVPLDSLAVVARVAGGRLEVG